MLPNKRVCVGLSKIIFSQLSCTLNRNAICVFAVAARPLTQGPVSLRLHVMRCPRASFARAPGLY
jgi:hypothetical protein